MPMQFTLGPMLVSAVFQCDCIAETEKSQLSPILQQTDDPICIIHADGQYIFRTTALVYWRCPRVLVLRSCCLCSSKKKNTNREITLCFGLERKCGFYAVRITVFRVTTEPTYPNDAAATHHFLQISAGHICSPAHGGARTAAKSYVHTVRSVQR